MDGGPVMAFDLRFQHWEGGHPNHRHVLAQVGNKNPLSAPITPQNVDENGVAQH